MITVSCIKFWPTNISNIKDPLAVDSSQAVILWVV